LAGRKRKKSTTSNYLISTDATDLSRGGDSYIGKVRSNLLGTQFSIFDNGDTPKRNSAGGSDRTGFREELASVIYVSSLLVICFSVSTNEFYCEFHESQLIIESYCS